MLPCLARCAPLVIRTPCSDRLVRRAGPTAAARGRRGCPSAPAPRPAAAPPGPRPKCARNRPTLQPFASSYPSRSLWLRRPAAIGQHVARDPGSSAVLPTQQTCAAWTGIEKSSAARTQGFFRRRQPGRTSIGKTSRTLSLFKCHGVVQGRTPGRVLLPPGTGGKPSVAGRPPTPSRGIAGLHQAPGVSTS
jgi:hypothetical protein